MNRKSNGICPRCGVNPKEPGLSYCPACRRAYQNELRRRRRLAAPKVCARCRNNPRVPGKTMCQECLNQLARAYRQRSRNKAVAAENWKKLLALAADWQKARKNPGGSGAKTPQRIVKVIPVDPGVALEQMADACEKRHYDPEVMLWFVRVLPKLIFEEATPGQHHTIRPVYRGQVKTAAAGRK